MVRSRSILVVAISIHSSTQELTHKAFCFNFIWRYFNSQLHAGADDYNIYQTLLRIISIHSSTQELTVCNV